MGAAAYNRGSQAISRQIEADIEAHRRHEDFFIMENMNALPKDPNARTPFGPIEFVFSHGGCWAQCPVTGFGFFYKDLRAAVKAFNVEITGRVDGKWTAVPTKRTCEHLQSIRPAA